MKRILLITFITQLMFVGLVNAQNVVKSLDVPQSVQGVSSVQISSGNVNQAPDNASQTTTIRNADGTVTDVSTTPAKQDPQKDHSQGGLELSYIGWTGQNGFDMTFSGKWWFAGWSGVWGETNSYLKKNQWFRFGAGTHYRYHLSKHFYLDGRISMYYMLGVTLMKGQKKEQYSHGFCLGFRPAIGVDIFKIKQSECSIYAAYEGYGYNFKSYGQLWTAGICFGF